MPYRIPDPNALVATSTTATGPSAPMSTEEADVRALVDAPGELQPLLKELAELRAVVLTAEAAEREAATGAFAAAPEVDTIASAGQALGTAWKQYQEASRATARRPDLSAQGRTEAEAKLQATRDAAVNQIAGTVLSSVGDRLLAKYPAPAPYPAPTTEVTNAVQLVYASFPMKTASNFARESLAVFRRAITAPNMADRVVANQLVYHGYLPLCQRRAEAPEKFAQPFKDFNAGLADTMQVHLDTQFQAGRHRLAVAFVASARESFTFLQNMARQSGWDDFLMATAAPVFVWPVRGPHEVA